MWKIELKEIDKVIIDKTKAYTVTCGQSVLVREAWFCYPDSTKANKYYKREHWCYKTPTGRLARIQPPPTHVLEFEPT